MAEALTLIGAMYRHEKQIRDDTLTGAAKREYRTVHIRPVVDAFWKWCRTSCERTDLLPKNPLAKALNYALQRRMGLEVFLDDPQVAIDTNHFGNYIHGSTRSRADSDYATLVFPGPDSPWRLAKSGAVRSRLSRCLPVLGPPQAISGLIEDSLRPRPHCPNPAFLLDLGNVNS